MTLAVCLCVYVSLLYLLLLQVGRTSVTVTRELAEGGFGTVYLVQVGGVTVVVVVARSCS